MDYAMSEGDVLPGRQVARVVESRNSDYSKGKVSLLLSIDWTSFDRSH